MVHSIAYIFLTKHGILFVFQTVGPFSVIGVDEKAPASPPLWIRHC